MSEERKNGARESDNLLEISDLHVQYNTDDAVVHALNGLSLKVKKAPSWGWSERLAPEKPRWHYPF